MLRARPIFACLAQLKSFRIVLHLFLDSAFERGVPTPAYRTKPLSKLAVEIFVQPPKPGARMPRVKLENGGDTAPIYKIKGSHRKIYLD